MMRAAATFALLTAAYSVTLAAETVLRLEDATVRYDETRWRASLAGRSATFVSQRELARGLDPVMLHVVDDAAPCAALARRAFRSGAYDERTVAIEKTIIGGIAGVRLAAHTRCRNATPRGEVACVRIGGRAYLLESLQPGCHGRNLFSGIDPLGEIAAGISFATTAQ